tara:strand:+ start:95 stop:256 length:162 start_codon:yes stop_codon:yes gene_type:complete
MQAGFAFLLLGETSFETAFGLLRMRIYNCRFILRSAKRVSKDVSKDQSAHTSP